MDRLMFQERLLNTTIARCHVLLIVLFIIIALLILDAVYKNKTKASRGISLVYLLTGKTNFTPRFTLNQQMILKAVVAIIIIFVICSYAIATYSDINNQQYLELHVQNIQDVSSKKNLFSLGRVCVVDCNGEQFFFDLPYGCEDGEFPIGIGGTVWYAKETKVALAFIPEK